MESPGLLDFISEEMSRDEGFIIDRGGLAEAMAAQHLPAGSGKRLPGRDGRVNLSGAQGGSPFHRQGGTAY